jgi:hypothetical protein
MADYEPYEIIDNGRIIPAHERGLVRNQPKAQNFEAALQILLTATGLEDAGLTDNDVEWEEHAKNEIPRIYSAYYIHPEEALFVLTGIIPERASYRFNWKDSVYFTMRPNFGLLCIMSNSNEMPLNCYESKIRDKLFDYAWEEIEVIYRAIKNGEILNDGNTEAPFEQWTALFQKRGFDLSHIPQDFLNDPLSVLKKENSVLKARCAAFENDDNPLSSDNQPKELKIANEAWEKLYGTKSPKQRPHRGHIKYITDWLSKNYPTLSIRARGRIATMINPNPHGGTPTIGSPAT